MNEKITIFTLLGIRFRDSVLDKQVSDNLIVRAFPGSGSGPVVNAFRTASGVYAFQGLPGMHDIETYEGDSVPGPPLSGKKSFIIEIKDKLRRFLPVVFTVKLPLPYNGVYLSGGEDGVTETPPSGSNPPAFYLFSAPTRTVSCGLAAIRATLVEQSTRKPAAYAMMEVRVEEEEVTNKWYGIADDRGCITVLFPYPSIKISLNTSPPADTDTLLYQHEWKLTIRVRYAPAELSYPVDMKIPLLESILKQSPGVIWTVRAEAPVIDAYVSEWSTVLTFGQELILRTEGVEKSELWIDAGTSPP